MPHANLGSNVCMYRGTDRDTSMTAHHQNTAVSHRSLAPAHISTMHPTNTTPTFLLPAQLPVDGFRLACMAVHEIMSKGRRHLTSKGRRIQSYMHKSADVVH
jgi:hypothetical protein